MRLFKRANSVDLVHDNDKKITEELGTPPEKAPASPQPAEPPSETPVAGAGPGGPGPVAEAEPESEPRDVEPVADDARAENQSATDKWVQETEEAVAQARERGTPAAWRNAAQAAGVVAEMAQTMRVTTHAHELAERLARAAEVAAQEASAATHAAADAMRAAEQSAQVAEEAARTAHAAAQAASDAKQKTEQTARAAPKAVETAQAAARAAADAKATADQLDQVVVAARQANTPEAWSEALQVAAAVWAKESGHTPAPGARLEAPA